MSILANANAIGSSGIDTGDIPASLRFRSAASASLTRTITTDATSTYFAAVKRGRLGAISPIFDTNIRFNANDTLTAFGLTTTAVFRDPTSWLYIHVSNGGLYVNGVFYGAVTTSAITNLRIGFDGTNYFDGYMARVGVVAGSSSSYTNFGYLNTETNEWVSKSQAQVKAVVDAGGTNSFMLDFDNATSLITLGYDKSSKGNNWTLNNFSLTAGVTYDHMLDVPGNSFATLSPIDKAASVVASSGNLAVTGGVNIPIRATVAMESGKWYAEHVITTHSTAILFGLMSSTASPIGGIVGGLNTGGVGYSSNGTKWINGVNTAYGAAFTTNDIVGCTYDADIGEVTFYKNGVSQGTLTGMPAPLSFAYSTGSGTTSHINFGQRPFAYTPPTGFKALCQANLPENGTVTVSGTFTGNANADGPFVWCNGVPNTLTINGNAVAFGTHADRTAGGFKLRTSSASYNAAGSNSWTATITSNIQNLFKWRNARGNP